MPPPTLLSLIRADHCPFHSGLATLDLLLADLNPHDTELFDAALDLRSLCKAAEDPEACLTQLFRVRRLLNGRHYLPFFRVRCWARRTFRIDVRTQRGAPWRAVALPFDAARMDELMNAGLATIADDFGDIPATAQARVSFATDARPVS